MGDDGAGTCLSSYSGLRTNSCKQNCEGLESKGHELGRQIEELQVVLENERRKNRRLLEESKERSVTSSNAMKQPASKRLSLKLDRADDDADEVRSAIKPSANS